MSDLPHLANSPDFEQAVGPLDAAQTQAVLRLLIDTYYGEPQPIYAVRDLAWFHAELDGALSGVVAAAARSCEWCTEGRHTYCDSCGRTTAERFCPSCGSLTCEIEAMEVGDARERAGLPRHEEEGSHPA